MRGRRGGEAGGVDNYSIKQCTEWKNIFQYQFLPEKAHVFSLILKADVVAEDDPSPSRIQRRGKKS